MFTFSYPYIIFYLLYIYMLYSVLYVTFNLEGCQLYIINQIKSNQIKTIRQLEICEGTELIIFGDKPHMNSMQTCNSVTFYFMKKTHFLILAGSVFCQKMIRSSDYCCTAVNRPNNSLAKYTSC